MSSSSSGQLSRRGSVLREAPAVRPAALDRELTGLSARSFDPERIEAACREGYTSGLAQGRDEGFAAGMTAGRSAALAELADAKRRLGALLVSLRDQLAAVGHQEEALRTATSAAITEGALALAEAVLGRELSVATNPGLDAIRRAVTLAPTDAATATARLHPSDVALLGPLDHLALGTVVEVVEDPTIEPGGCVLEVGDTSIDAQLRTALARAAAVLEEGG